MEHLVGGKRDLLNEIVDKRSRLLRHAPRIEQWRRRVHKVVEGFRHVKSLPRETPFRPELLKYCPIGYVACAEAYFRLLIGNLIDRDKTIRARVAAFKDIKFTSEVVLGLQDNRVSLGEFIAHLLPLNNLTDINHVMSILIEADYLALIKSRPASDWNPKPIGELFPTLVPDIERFFNLRHLFAHELATKGKVSVRQIENGMGMTGLLVVETEEYVSSEIFHEPISWN